MRQIVPEIKDPVVLINNQQKTITGGITTFLPDVHDFDVHRSPITGHADIVSRGEYASGTIDVFDISIADYTSLKGMQGTSTRLWPFGTGGIPGTILYYPFVDIIITRVYPYHKNQIYYLDACVIEFISQKKYTLKREQTNGVGGGV